VATDSFGYFSLLKILSIAPSASYSKIHRKYSHNATSYMLCSNRNACSLSSHLQNQQGTSTPTEEPDYYFNEDYFSDGDSDSSDIEPSHMPSDDEPSSAQLPSSSQQRSTTRQGRAKGKTFASKVDMEQIVAVKRMRCCKKTDAYGRPDPCLLHLDSYTMYRLREEMYLSTDGESRSRDKVRHLVMQLNFVRYLIYRTLLTISFMH
jgi:hypothetical protein